MPYIEVFADVACPFTHVGLRRLAAHRDTFGRDDVVLRVLAWPARARERPSHRPGRGHRGDRRVGRDAAADLFARYSEASFPATSMPALDLAHAAAHVDDREGEQMSLALRTALLKTAAMSPTRGCWTRSRMSTASRWIRSRIAGVLADWNEGQAPA